MTKQETKEYNMKTNFVKPSEILFCSECGSQMIESLICAENYVAYYESGSYRPYSRFDRETGKRQYVYKYICPNKGKYNWFDKHDKFTKDKIITI